MFVLKVIPLLIVSVLIYNIIVFLTGTGLVQDCSMSNIQRIGVHIRGNIEPTVPDVDVIGLTYEGKGDGDFLDYGVEFGGGGLGSVENSTITD